MTAEQLRGLKNKVPFKPFSIHMTEGKSFAIRDPEDLFIHPDWSVDALVVQPRGRFSFIYLRNVASVSSEGRWPTMKRRGRGKNGHGGD
ncbi:MAG: hypothetical protein QOE14_1938 [Humisphaera sp.]|nr:hypothetical protein [Humisphaera sp.]